MKADVYYGGKINFHLFAVANSKSFGENKIYGYAKIPYTKSKELDIYIQTGYEDIKLEDYKEPLNKEIQKTITSKQFLTCLINYSFASTNKPIILKLNKCLIEIKSTNNIPILNKKYTSEIQENKGEKYIMPKLICRKEKIKELCHIAYQKAEMFDNNIIDSEKFKKHMHNILNNMNDTELNIDSEFVYKELASIYEVKYKHLTLLEMKKDIIKHLNIESTKNNNNESLVNDIIISYFKIYSLNDVEIEELFNIKIDSDDMINIVSEIIYFKDNQGAIC